jgi:phenylacetate-CoA ligase
MSKFDRFYAKLPTWAQHVAVSAYGYYWSWLRFGPGYRDFLGEYREREKFTSLEWDNWQQARLRKVLEVAAERVPYYQNAWSDAEKTAARDGRLEDLPLLEKAALRADPKAFLRQDIHPKLELIFHTSGSTGTPIATYWLISELRDSLALREARSAGWAGVSFGEPRATFSGRIVEPDPESAGPFYRYNLAEKQVYFSAFHLRPNTAQDYVHALWRHKVRWMTGYAVSFYLLAKFILEQNLSVPPLRAVITTSEKLTPNMRQVMKAAYRCRIFEEYSTVENVLFASECENGRLHVSPDVAVVEVLRPDGSHCLPGEVGEVVTTSLVRHYQPLIRYRLGDMAAWDSTPCPCGRQMPVLKEVVGRIEDVVIGPDGRRMVRFHGIFVDQPHVQEGQIIQETLENIRVKVVPTSGFGQRDVDEIAQRIRQRLGGQVQVQVDVVDHIPRTAAGKYQAVISRLHEQGLPEAERTGAAEPSLS